MHVWWFDGLASTMTGRDYAPAELIPIELPEWPVARLDEPSRPEAVQPSEAPERRAERRPDRPKRGGKRVANEPAPVPDSGTGGLLRGRDERAKEVALGLAGDGDLRGSAALYAESVPGGAVEGPRRPNERGPSDDYTFVREGGKWIYRDPGGKFVATLQPDGGVEFRNKLYDINVVSTPGISGDGEHFVGVEVEYDPVGVARLSIGKDPSPRIKAQLLAATFEMRMEVATKYHKERLLEQLAGIGDELDGIWNRSLSVAERKRLLFELWDECDEPGGQLPGFQTADASALDEIRRQYAKAARQKIIRFIRSVVPAEGPDAYTDIELATLNHRRVSEHPFAPYDS